VGSREHDVAVRDNVSSDSGGGNDECRTVLMRLRNIGKAAVAKMACREESGAALARRRSGERDVTLERRNHTPLVADNDGGEVAGSGEEVRRVEKGM
jgi:hypothetical protein